MKTKLGSDKTQKSTHQSLTKPFGKKFMSFVLCICMLTAMLSAMPISVFAEESGRCGVYATWTLDDEGTLTISGTGNMTDWNSSIVAPWHGYRDRIKTVVIQNSVTSIGNGAFSGCSSLTSITIPNSVTSIGGDAFEDCSSLTSINIPNSVISIGDYAFRSCESLTSINIPDSVTSIGAEAFNYSGLKSVDISDNISYIGTCAFACCRFLENINVGSKNLNYSSLDGNLYTKDKTILYQYAIGKKNTSFDIPNDVMTIGECAFANAELTSINIPYGVIYIENYAFTDSLITKIYIPGSVMSVDEGAFDCCFKLTDVNIANGVKIIGEDAFRGCESLTSITIPNGVTSIGDNAFSYCKSLTSISIPNSVTSIGNSAFGDCTSLTSINIPNSVTSIGDYAFSLCDSLTSITIPNSVTSIGEYTFFHCSSLTSITIPNSVTSIGGDAFEDCSSLTSINIPNSVTYIGNYVFRGCGSLTSVTIPNSVTSIGYGAFEGCSSLTSVTIPNSVTSIGYGAFEGCESLTSINIPNSVTYIGNYVFRGCYNLTDVYYTGSEEQWKKIDKDFLNEELTNATIHYNCVDKSDGAWQGATEDIKNRNSKELKLAIYQNKSDSAKTDDSYALASGASVSNNIDSAVSDSKGMVTLKNSGDNITVKKQGYLERTLTARRAAMSKNIYLQPNSGNKPIIQAVWVGDTDVYNSSYSVDITSKDTIKIEAEVVWKGGSQGKIYLMQDSRRAEFGGNTLSTVLSNDFDVSKTIYIVAEDTNGNATKKKLKFKAGGSMNDSVNGYKLSFGDSISGTIPKNIPVIGGGKVGLDIPMIPLTVTFEDNKFYAVLGLDVAKASEDYSFTANINGNTTSKYEKTTKYLFENIKDGFKKSADKYNFSKLKSKWKKAKYNYSAKLGFEADLTVLGYLEGYVDSNGGVSLLDGGVGINPSFGISIGSQIIPVPPLYWEAELKGEIEGMVSLYMNDTAKNFKPSGSIGGSVTLKGGVGLGASGVAGVSGGVKGSIGIDWDIYAAKQDYVAVSGSIGAYVKAFTGPITWIDKSFPFAKGIIWDYPSTRVNMLSLGDETDFYNADEYSLIDRGYAEIESRFTANDVDIEMFAFAPQNKTEKTLKTNVYTYSEPKLVEFSDGTMLAIWLDDDTARSAINRTTVVYSYYDGASWSAPEQVSNDGTGDYAPDLKIINDTAYIAWINSDKKLSDDAEKTEIFKTWEISVAEFDKTNKTFKNISAVTDNAETDMMPRIFGDNSEISIVWVKNSSDDIFGQSNTYSIMTSTLSNGEWSDVKVYADGLMPIDSLDGCRYGNSTYIAYATDLDGDQTDCTDKEVYLNKKRLTDNAVLDSKPVFSNDALYYYSGGEIVEYNLADGSSKTVAEAVSTDRFNVISDGKNSAIVYGNSDSLITELSAVMYDSESEKWGESITLTDLDSDITGYSGVFSKDGKMKFIINKTAITGDIDSENPYGQTDISLFTVIPGYDLSVGDIVYHEEMLLPGNTLELYTEVKNSGELTVNDYKVEISDNSGQILATTYNKDSILPGETVDFTAYYPLGNDDFVPHNIKLTVVPIRVTDSDDSDNSAEVYLNCENISLENLDYGIANDGSVVIYGDVVNRGYGEAEGITATLYKDSPDGEKVESVKINEKLGTLDLAPISFNVPFENNAVYYVKLDKAGQNSDFVVLEYQSKDMIMFNRDANNIAVNSTKETGTATLAAALYRDGRLVELQMTPISIKVGENIFESPISDYKNADTVKIMVWDNLGKMTPLFDSCTVDLK